MQIISNFWRIIFNIKELAKFYPIKALLPDPKKADKIVAGPVKSYSKKEIEKIIHQNPIHFLNIVYPAIGNFENETLYHSKLKEGRQKLNALLQKKVYQQAEQAAFYIYKQTKKNRSHTGIIGALSIDCIDNGTLKPHEDTLTNREEKLAEYLKVIDIHAEPVFITGPNNKNINKVIKDVTLEKPAISFLSDDEAKHQLWPVFIKQYEQTLHAEFAKFKHLYIADGHHRTASAIKFGKNMRKNNPDYTGMEPYNFFSAIYFPENEIALLEFNRLLKNIPKGSVATMLIALSANFAITEGRNKTTALYFYVYANKKWLTLTPNNNLLKHCDAANLLPSAFLTEKILKPYLDIHDLRTDNRVEFDGGATNFSALEKMIDEEKYTIAFVLPPVSFAQFKQFAENGWPMPPKSTWFEPKLPNGLVIYTLDVYKFT